MSNTFLTCLFMFILVLSCISAQTDPCNTDHPDKKSCLADTKTGGGCAWCQCEAVPSACYTTADAARLPPGVYSCTNATSMFLRGGVEEEY